MLKTIGCGLLVSALMCSLPAGASAGLAGLSDSRSNENAYSSLDEARVFCFNRASGRFLHWGSCNGGAPRVYCRNRWSGTSFTGAHADIELLLCAWPVAMTS